MTSIILTGAPGVGKTTIVMDVAQKLKARGVRVGPHFIFVYYFETLTRPMLNFAPR